MNRLAELLDDFSLLMDRSDRIDALISLGERFESTTRRQAPYEDAHRAPGCESGAYVWVDLDPQGGMDLDFAVENPQGLSARAMAVVLKDCFHGAKPEELNGIPDDLVDRIFGRELSMGKSLGLNELVRLTKRLGQTAC